MRFTLYPVLLSIFFSLASGSTLALDPVDGIYLKSKAETENQANTKNGSIYLGEMITDDLGDITLLPVDNENSKYHLMLEYGSESEIDMDREYLYEAVIVIAGHAFDISSKGSDGEPDNRRLTLSSHINSQKTASEVAKQLDFDLKKRVHPGHDVTIEWKGESSYTKNQPVVFQMKLINSGDVPVRFLDGGRNRGTRDNQFSFEATLDGESVKVKEAFDFGGLAGYRTLKPGESLEKQVDVNKWFTFDKPGTYHVTGMFQLNLYEEDNRFPSAIWDEQVSSDFKIVIVD